MDKLKPCPFCGNEKLREGQGDMYFIECEPCYDTFGTSVCAEGTARHDAVAMWNRRSRQESPSEPHDLRQLVEYIDERLIEVERHPALSIPALHRPPKPQSMDVQSEVDIATHENDMGRAELHSPERKYDDELSKDLWTRGQK